MSWRTLLLVRWREVAQIAQVRKYIPKIGHFFTFIPFILEDSSSEEETPVFKPHMKAMLLASMEEVRQLDSIDNRARNVDLYTTKKNIKKGTQNPDIHNAVKKPKQVLNKKSFTVSHFTPEEDKILLEAMSSGEKLDLARLAKKINRARSSVKTRVEKLILTGGVSTKTFSKFTLQEDLTIIDSAVKNLQQFSKLDDTPLEDAHDLAGKLRRKKESVKERWEVRLKVWLKSYYTNTLNLDIRVMLANVVADNFEKFDSIDWNYVLSFKEFSGHTSHSIRYQFYSRIFQRAKVKYKGEKTDLTLRDIATFASKENPEKIPESILKRQREIIEYFEEKVKELGIKNFL